MFVSSFGFLIKFQVNKSSRTQPSQYIFLTSQLFRPWTWHVQCGVTPSPRSPGSRTNRKLCLTTTTRSLSRAASLPAWPLNPLRWMIQASTASTCGTSMAASLWRSPSVCTSWARRSMNPSWDRWRDPPQHPSPPHHPPQSPRLLHHPWRPLPQPRLLNPQLHLKPQSPLPRLPNPPPHLGVPSPPLLPDSWGPQRPPRSKTRSCYVTSSGWFRYWYRKKTYSAW